MSLTLPNPTLGCMYYSRLTSGVSFISLLVFRPCSYYTTGPFVSSVCRFPLQFVVLLLNFYWGLNPLFCQY